MVKYRLMWQEKGEWKKKEFNTAKDLFENYGKIQLKKGAMNLIAETWNMKTGRWNIYNG